MTSGPGSPSGPRLPQLLVSVLLLGIAGSMIGPYLVLFGDEAQLSPLPVGVFMSVIAVSGLAVSTWLGRRYDRSASRAPALIALAAPAVGYLALTTTTPRCCRARSPCRITSPAPWSVPTATSGCCSACARWWRSRRR